MPRIQGIYIITNIGTADTYIGSSININERWSDHLWHLKNNRHKNALLQSDYNKDEVNAFAAATLELVEQIEQLAVREQYHLDSLRPSYNQGKIAARAPYRTWRSDEADRKRFWSKVDQTAEGCWLWQGTMLQQGYGCFKIAGKMYKAHRVAYLYAVNSIPEGLVLCHSCDVRHCVRPGHLFVGTHQDNSNDAVSKGRQAKGERHGSRLHPEKVTRGDKHWSHLHPEQKRGELNGRAILNRKQVEEIRARYAAGSVSQLVLSDEYHVAQTTISAIVRGLRWKD